MSENSSSNRPPRPSLPTRDHQTDLGGILGRSSETAHDGFMGIEVEQDEVTSEERQRVKRRSRNAVTSAALVFAVALVMVVAIISPRLGWFERKDYSGEGNGPPSPSLLLKALQILVSLTLWKNRELSLMPAGSWKSTRRQLLISFSSQGSTSFKRR